MTDKDVVWAGGGDSGQPEARRGGSPCVSCGDTRVPSDRGLLLVAVRVDHPAEIRRRIETVLAVAATYDRPPDTQAAVFYKPLAELVANDFDALAYFVGVDSTRRLNIGDVASQDGSDV